jgi:hypothetical protein
VGWQIKLQQACGLLSEARFILADADWSNREVGMKGNLSFEKVRVARELDRMDRWSFTSVPVDQSHTVYSFVNV